MSETKKQKKQEITGPLSEASRAFAAFTKQQPYYKPAKKKVEAGKK